MTKINQIFKLTNDATVADKIVIENNKRALKGNVNTLSLTNEVNKLLKVGMLDECLKYDYTPNNQVIFSFLLNDKNELASNYGIANVKIVVDKNDIETNIDNIKSLNLLTNNAKNVIVYKTAQDLFSAGAIKDSLLRGISICTYVTEKQAKKLTFPVQKQAHDNKIGKYLLFDDEQLSW